MGYIRVSSGDQNPDRQLDDVHLDRVFTDHASGKDVHRPQLAALLDFVRDGDTVMVHSMDRLARNLDDLRRLVKMLTQRGIRITFVKEQLTFTGEDAPLAQLLLSVMGAFAEFERALIRERQREGIALAKKRGVYKGRKPSLRPDQVVQLRQRVAQGEKKGIASDDHGGKYVGPPLSILSAPVPSLGLDGNVAVCHLCNMSHSLHGDCGNLGQTLWPQTPHSSWDKLCHRGNRIVSLGSSSLATLFGQSIGGGVPRPVYGPWDSVFYSPQSEALLGVGLSREQA